MSDLGKRLRKLRMAMGFTLDKLASLSDSSKSYIWELENKNPPRPSAEKLSRLAAELETTMEFLLYGEKDDQEDATDIRFYRDYLKLKPAIKSKIRQTVKIWSAQ